MAIVAFTAAAAALIYARLQSPIYRANVRLEVSARFDNGQQLALERLLPQLAQRVKTTDVAREVDSRLRLDLGPEAILAKLRAEAVPQNAQIHVEADDVDAPRAEAIVFETARVFEEQHAARNQGIPSQDRAIVSILDRPSPARLIWPQARALASAALLLGLMAGAMLALLLEYLDDTIKSPEDVERALGMITLGRVPSGIGLLSTVPEAAAPANADQARERVG